jgi:hypothetical protein
MATSGASTELPAQTWEGFMFQNGVDGAAGTTASNENQDWWAGKIDAGERTIDDLKTALSNTGHYKNYVEAAVRLYQAAFGRQPDTDGITHWVGSLSAGAVTTTGIATLFTESEEFTNRFGTGDEITVDYVTALYSNVLGREPDAPGLDSWLNSGLTRGAILRGFSDSQEFITSSSGDIFNLLSGVADGTPLDPVRSLADWFSNGLESLFSHTLTTSADTIVGTDEVEVVTGVIYLDTGTTLNTNDTTKSGGIDTIDLGGGSDVLNLTLINDTTGSLAFGTVTTSNVETVNITITELSAQGYGNPLTLVDSSVSSIDILGNGGLRLTFAGTELKSIDASGLTSAGFGVDFTSGVLTSAMTVTGSSSVSGDYFDFGSALGPITITETAGTNFIIGGGGNDTITGGAGNDTLYGSLGDDRIVGGDGDDIIVGGLGADTIIAGEGLLANYFGTDTIAIGGEGNTAVANNFSAGASSATFAAAQSTVGMDFIFGFSRISNDKINISSDNRHEWSTILLDGTSTQGLSTAGDVTLMQGNYSAVNETFTGVIGGADSMLVYDTNGIEEGGIYQAVILIGYQDIGTTDTISSDGIFTAI